MIDRSPRVLAGLPRWVWTVRLLHQSDVAGLKGWAATIQARAVVESAGTPREEVIR